jgi:hypothetical protein
MSHVPFHTRKLPTRRRSSQPTLEDPDDHDETTNDNAHVIRGACINWTEMDGALSVTPDLIAELVDNGSLAVHFHILYRTETRSGWRSCHRVEPEVECGSTIFIVDMAVTKPTETQRGPPVPSFLLRAFQRRASSAIPTGVHLSMANHALTPRAHILDDWAPVCILHVAKALSLCDLSLEGFNIIHQSHHLAHVVPLVPANLFSGIATRYIITRREQTKLGVDHNTNIVNWKVKYAVPITYPGGQSDVVQIAWETTDPGPLAVDEDLLRGAQLRGLLPIACRVCASPPGTNVTGSADTPYIKVEWVATNQVCRVVLRLGILLLENVNAEGVQRLVLTAPRPRGSTDVPRWLHAIGARCAEWRIEVEVVPPIQRHGIISTLYLHHLIRRLVGGIQVIPRSVFVAMCRDQQGKVDKQTMHHGAARIALAAICGRAGIHTHRQTGYPIQSRPHDLTEGDLPHLMYTLVTPKVNGLEAFLLGYRTGFAVLFRSGVVRTYPWVESIAPLFPLLVEGEVLGLDVTSTCIAFIAYDLAVTPVQSYTDNGQFPALGSNFNIASMYLWSYLSRNGMKFS